MRRGAERTTRRRAIPPSRASLETINPPISARGSRVKRRASPASTSQPPLRDASDVDDVDDMLTNFSVALTTI